MNDTPILLGPDGNAVASVRAETHWPPEFMRYLATFAEAAGDHNLGLHCCQCKQALRGHNAREDNYWHMECGCRKYLGRNPLPTSMRQAN